MRYAAQRWLARHATVQCNRTLPFALLTASFGLLLAALGRTPGATRGLAIMVTLILVMVGVRLIKKGTPPVPEQALEEIRLTRETLRGGHGR